MSDHLQDGWEALRKLRAHGAPGGGTPQVLVWAANEVARLRELEDAILRFMDGESEEAFEALAELAEAITKRRTADGPQTTDGPQTADPASGDSA